MQRYFIDEKCLKDEEIRIDAYNHKHMQRVMRYHNGDQVICILPSAKTDIYGIIDIETGLLKRVEELHGNRE